MGCPFLPSHPCLPLAAGKRAAAVQCPGVPRPGLEGRMPAHVSAGTPQMGALCRAAPGRVRPKAGAAASARSVTPGSAASPARAQGRGQTGSSVGSLPLLAAGSVPLAGTELPRGDAGGSRSLICAASFRP